MGTEGVPSADSPRSGLVGRAEDCAAITALLRGAEAGQGGALVLVGEAGIGKTVLLDYAREQARSMRILRARGIEAEAEVAFSGLDELLLPLRGRLGALPQRQAVALAGALALGPSTGSDPFAVGAATLGLLADAASTGPVLALVDDAQWLDHASLDAIVFAARRLDAEPVAMLIATRDGASDPAKRGLRGRRVHGLDRAAAAALLSAQTGQPVTDELSEHLWRETGGNPMALIELPHLVEGGLESAVEELGHRPLPVAERIEEAFAARVATLSPSVQAALLLAAANDGPDVDIVLSALPALGARTDELGVAEAAGLVRIEDGRIEYRHPLIRSSVYHRAEAAQRRAAHRALADALRGGDETSAVRRAWHLAQSVVGRDEAVAASLEASAWSACRRGGFAAGAQAWERAGRLSPDRARAAVRLAQAAEAWRLANHHHRALEVADEAGLLSADPLLAADLALLRARVGVHRGPAPGAVAQLRESAEEVLGRSRTRAVQLLAVAVMTGIVVGDLRSVTGVAERASELAHGTGGDAELVAALQLGKVRVLTGDIVGGLALVLRASELLEPDRPIDRVEELIQIAPALLAVEAYGLEEQILDAAIRGQRAASSLGMLAYSLGAMAELETRRGRWSPAEAHATEGLQLARESGQVGQMSYNLARAARVDAGRGRDARCREAVAEAQRLAASVGYASTVPYAASSLGLLELGRGRLAEAVRAFETAGNAFLEQGFLTPGRLEWQADLIEARIRLGSEREALEAMGRLEATIRMCGDPSSSGVADGCRLAAATLARCRGLLADPQVAATWFMAAIEAHRSTDVPFELARTRLCFGEQLRRSGQKVEARRELSAALDTFDLLGAAPWSDRARAELSAAGEPVRARAARAMDELTAQELQVALLVAGGATNREAGAALFLTEKTIEFHLAKIFRKLDIRSRTQLAAWALRQLPTTSAGAIGSS